MVRYSGVQPHIVKVIHGRAHAIVFRNRQCRAKTFNGWKPSAVLPYQHIQAAMEIEPVRYFSF